MDFRVMSFDGLMSSETKPGITGISSGYGSLSSVDPETKQIRYGSGFPKQERSLTNEDIWRSSKLLKADSLLLQQQRSSTSLAALHSHSYSSRTDSVPKESQILSFCCPQEETLVADRSNQSLTLFPIFHQYSDRDTDFFSENLESGTMHAGVFTPSQKDELEHQALIYKYLTANVPIPTNLLLPIRKAVESSRMPCFAGSLLRPSSFGLTAFHLGYSGNADPEPGRCRRTDGKKWRCSRDAVADQKYCERHMNRGRHRSRKPVEGQSPHSATASTTHDKNSKQSIPSASVAPVVPVAQGGSVSNTLHINFTAPGSTDFSQAKRTMVEKENLLHSGSFSSSHTGSCLSTGGNFGRLEDLASRGSSLQDSGRQFMEEDWQSKNQSDCSAVSWHQVEYHSEKPHLSVSIPMATADYMSSTSSPATNERSTLSPLRLSYELDSIQMGLGVGGMTEESKQRQPNLIPISWGPVMGGPLGEMLNCGSSSHLPALNLMTEGWDSSSRLDSSPTGVVSKANFSSVSNSSAGSSPRG